MYVIAVRYGGIGPTKVKKRIAMNDSIRPIFICVAMGVFNIIMYNMSHLIINIIAATVCLMTAFYIFLDSNWWRFKR